MQMLIKGLMIVGALTLSHASMANEYQQKTQLICDKLRQCSVDEINRLSPTLTDEQRQVMLSSIDTACEAMGKQYPQKASDPFAKEGLQCMNAIIDSTCNQLTKPNSELASCNTYYQQVEAAQREQLLLPLTP